MSVPSLFDARARRLMGDLYGEPAKPSREAYEAQLTEWYELTSKRHTPAELAAIEADQVRRIEVMK